MRFWYIQFSHKNLYHTIYRSNNGQYENSVFNKQRESPKKKIREKFKRKFQLFVDIVKHRV